LKRTLHLAPLFGVLLVIGLTGCQTTPAGPTAAPPPVPPGGTSPRLPEIEAAGRALYLNKCARCHIFYHPARYNAADWEMWMNKMSRKARLEPVQRQVLEQYLGAYRLAPDGT